MYSLPTLCGPKVVSSSVKVEMMVTACEGLIDRMKEGMVSGANDPY